MPLQRPRSSITTGGVLLLASAIVAIGVVLDYLPIWMVFVVLAIWLTNLLYGVLSHLRRAKNERRRS